MVQVIKTPCPWFDYFFPFFFNIISFLNRVMAYLHCTDLGSGAVQGIGLAQ